MTELAALAPAQLAEAAHGLHAAGFYNPNQPPNMQNWKQELERSLSSAQELNARIDDLYAERQRLQFDPSTPEGELDLFYKRYDDTMAKADAAHRTEVRRKLQLMEAAANRVAVYYDEVGDGPTNSYGLFEPTPQGFSLPQDNQLPQATETAALELSALPFIDPEFIKVESPLQPEVIVKECPFPTDRIISGVSLEAWSGRGASGLGGKEVIGRTDLPQNSITAILAYAQGPVSKTEADILLVKDPAGEYWGVSVGDGNHRIAAAKLRGQPTIPADLHLRSEQEIPILPFSVREQFGSSTEGHIGATATNSFISTSA